jgi:hypothetical protein
LSFNIRARRSSEARNARLQTMREAMQNRSFHAAIFTSP